MIWGMPQAAWIFCSLPFLIGIQLWSARVRQRALAHFGHHLIRAPSRGLRRIHHASTYLTLIGLNMALMDPLAPTLPSECAREVANETSPLHTSDPAAPPSLRRLAHDVILLIDCSASMTVPDCRLGQSRLDFAKEIADEIIAGLTGHTVALYGFTSGLTTVVPSTFDYFYSRLMLKRIAINEGDVAGTDLMEALEGVLRRHAQGGDQKARTLILMTDGGDVRLEQAKEGEREQQIEALCSRLQVPKVPVKLLTIGLGTAAGQLIPDLTYAEEPVLSALDEELLQRLSATGGGNYYFANDFSSLELANRIFSQLELTESEIEQAQLEEPHSGSGEEGGISICYDRPVRVPLILAIMGLGLTLWTQGVRSECVVEVA